MRVLVEREVEVGIEFAGGDFSKRTLLELAVDICAGSIAGTDLDIEAAESLMGAAIGMCCEEGAGSG